MVCYVLDLYPRPWNLQVLSHLAKHSHSLLRLNTIRYDAVCDESWWKYYFIHSVFLFYFQRLLQEMGTSGWRLDGVVDEIPDLCAYPPPVVPQPVLVLSHDPHWLPVGSRFESFTPRSLTLFMHS